MTKLLTICAFGCLMLGSGCGPSVQPSSDAGPATDAAPATDGLPCDEILDPILVPADCGGECVSLRHDVDHCGACGRSCDRRYNDSCYDGYCGCGEGAGCTEDAHCVQGLCVTPDPNGVPCDGVDVFCTEPGKLCVGGHCTTPQCREEVCNNYDDDCDGHVDENSDGQPMSEYCYSGEIGTEGVGPCQAGFRICRNGLWSDCEEEVTPIPEIGLLSCDGIDNDCDDCVDGDWSTGECSSSVPLFVDIVYIIDTSGSMSSEIDAVKTATSSFSSLFISSPNIHFGIMEVSGNPIVRVHHTLSNFFPFSLALTALTEGGGTEPTYDAVYKADTGDFDDPLGAPNYLGFQDDSLRIYIVFGDEDAAGQSQMSLTETDICDAIMDSGSILAVFTHPDQWEDWDECAIVKELSDDAAAMIAGLNEIFESPCISGP